MKGNHARADGGGPALAVVLGSGLGGVSDRFATGAALAFERLPGVTASTVPGQSGEIRYGRVGRRRCLFVCGRKHYYEGADNEIERLVGFLAGQGVGRLLLTSAAGSLRGALPPGRPVLVESLLDLQFRRPPPHNAGTAQTLETQRARPVALDPGMRAGLAEAARAARVGMERGVAACLSGPAYETAAEIRALDRMGVDIVTMSGAPEITTARAFGIQVAMIALITNWSTGVSADRLTHDDVLATSRRAGEALGAVIMRFAGAA